ncbi:MAG: hypothetical protein QOF51_3309 [Chloroflexota bacterium]|jgi:PAS domain S-box-containing protein|nr:hypothetical protein [Chloroflexota bacterium]
MGALSGCSVLVMDAPEHLERAPLWLEREGCMVQVVSNGPDGVAFAATSLPDVIVLNTSMAQSIATDACRDLKRSQATSRIPVLAITESSDPSTIEPVLEAGADDFLARPYTRVLLAERIHRLQRTKVLIDEVLRICEDLRAQATALRESERRHRMMSELLSDYTFVVDLQTDGSIVHVSGSTGFQEISGETFDEFHDVAAWERVVVPADLAAVHGYFESLQKGQPAVCEIQLIAKSEELRWLRLYGRPDPRSAAKSGKAIRIFGAAQDVTDRRRAEEALAASEARFRVLTELSSDLAYVAEVAPDGRVLNDWASETMSTLLGYSQSELQTRGGWASIAHPDDLPILEERERVLSAGKMHRCEFRVVTRRGEERWLADSARWHAHGSVTGNVRMYGAARDITDARRSERALREAEEAKIEAQARTLADLEQLNKAKGDFVSVVSHEFRTPLVGIQGFSEMLRDEDLTVDEVKEFAADINHEAQRLSRLINDMLDLDRMESGRVPLRLEVLDLNGLVAEETRIIQSASSQHRIHLYLDPALDALRADRDKITHVLTNLLGNAVKYSPEGGAITVRTRAEHDQAHIEVTDQGMGIPEEALDAVFQRYTRVDSPATRNIQGTGLGLPIVRQLVRMHGGDAWAESVLGRGSTFHVTIPRDLPSRAA